MFAEPHSRTSRVLAAGLAAGALVLAGCAHAPVPVEPANAKFFTPAQRTDTVSYADRVALAELDAEVDPVYLLGAGDHLSVQVLGRPEMSARHVVGPDGRISMPLVGTLRVAALTREKATATVEKEMRRYFKQPGVALSVEQYSANRVTVLGRVQNSGVINFDKVPTILEVLAPDILITAPNFGIQANAFAFRISWATNASVVVEASTTLANPAWVPMSTNSPTDGWSDFSDPEWTNYPNRFYRIRSPLS